MAAAHTRLAAATEGLKPEEVIHHLQTTVAQAEFEASRLGIRFDQPSADADPLTVGDGGPVLVIRRLVDPEED